MIKQSIQFAHVKQNARRESVYSTTSSAGSRNYRVANDQELATQTGEKSQNKYKPLVDSKIKKSVKKLNNLKLLGFHKAMEYQQVDGKNDLEQLKKTFKVNQKGLLYDNHQYFLTLNASVCNNHLLRQASPMERLKVSLFDEEKVVINSAAQLNTTTYSTQETPLNLDSRQQQNLFGLSQQLQQNIMNNNNNKKRATFRRRSCYCNQTGKQSQKAQKIDSILPTNLIKNRIFLRMKRKQEMKMNLTDKDQIILNLNRTFDIQEKNTARGGSNINSPNTINNMQQNFVFLDTPVSQKGTNSPLMNARQNNQLNNAHQNQAQKSQFSYANSPKNGSNTNQTHSNKRGDNGQFLHAQNSSQVTPKARSQNPRLTFTETVQSIKEEQSNSKILTPQSNTNSNNNNNNSNNNNTNVNTPNKGGSVINKGSQKREKSSNFSSANNNLRLSLNGNPVNKTHANRMSSNKNSPKQFTASPNKNTPSSNRSSAFFNSNSNANGQINSAFYGNFMTTSGKSQKEEQVFQPQTTDRRKKWIAKLRIASKLVGFQEKQRKKSFLYHQDYYKALEEVANNEVEQVHKEESNNQDDQNQEKRYVLVRKVKDNSNIHKIQMLNSIVNKHNLKFNNTIGSFIDLRTKSYNSLLPTSVPSFSAINSMKKKSRVVSPFISMDPALDDKRNHESNEKVSAYLKPLHILKSLSPNSKSSRKKSEPSKNPLLLFQSYTKGSKNSKNGLHKKLNETDKSSFQRSGWNKPTNSTTLTELHNSHINNNLSNNRFASINGLLLPPKQVNSMNGNQLNHSEQSLDEFQMNHIENKQQNETSKSSLGQVSNNERSNKSQQEIRSLDQFGRYEAYYTKQQQQQETLPQSKLSQTVTHFKAQTKAQQKFELLLNSQTMKNSNIFSSFKSSNSTKHNQLASINFKPNKSINESKLSFRNSSQPDLLKSAFKNDISHISSTSNNHIFVKTPQRQQSKPHYQLTKYDSKSNNKSILAHYNV